MYYKLVKQSRISFPVAVNNILQIFINLQFRGKYFQVNKANGKLTSINEIPFDIRLRYLCESITVNAVHVTAHCKCTC